MKIGMQYPMVCLVAQYATLDSSPSYVEQHPSRLLGTEQWESGRLPGYNLKWNLQKMKIFFNLFGGLIFDILN